MPPIAVVRSAQLKILFTNYKPGNRLNEYFIPRFAKYDASNLHCVVFPERSKPSNKMKAPRLEDINPWTKIKEVVWLEDECASGETDPNLVAQFG
jgi:hypothetical protein